MNKVWGVYPKRCSKLPPCVIVCWLAVFLSASRQSLPCSRSNPLGSVQSCLDSAWDVRCKVKGRGGNTYFIRCSNRRPYPDLRCSPKSHHLDRMICCDLICPLWFILLSSRFSGSFYLFSAFYTFSHSIQNNQCQLQAQLG